MIYDGKKIIPGLLLFVSLLVSPVLFTIARGKAAYVPKLELKAGAKECVESAEYMRRNHMTLLKNVWRESAVRRGDRTYVSSSGKTYTISLTGTCLDCHSNKAQFCDQCHNYVANKPVCWDCHNAPEGNN